MSHRLERGRPVECSHHDRDVRADDLRPRRLTALVLVTRHRVIDQANRRPRASTARSSRTVTGLPASANAWPTSARNRAAWFAPEERQHRVRQLPATAPQPTHTRTRPHTVTPPQHDTPHHTPPCRARRAMCGRRVRGFAIDLIPELVRTGRRPVTVGGVGWRTTGVPEDFEGRSGGGVGSGQRCSWQG